MAPKTDTPAIVLGMDSAMNGCGAAICFPHEPARNISKTIPMERGQAEALVPLVKDVVACAGIVFSDIDLIVTTRGPGTFTGLRVGLSAARSFALALDVPLLGVSTLEALAREYLHGQDEGAVAVLIESKRSDFYFQLFDTNGHALCDSSALDTKGILDALELHTGVIIGDAQLRFREECGAVPAGFTFLGSVGTQPDPLALGLIGLDGFFKGNYTDIAPLYLRGADVSQPKSSPRQLAQ